MTAPRRVVGWYDGQPVFARSDASTPALRSSSGKATTDPTRVRIAFAKLSAIDHDGDVTLPGAFAGNDQTLLGAWAHKSWTDNALPVGRGRVIEQNGWAIFDGHFFDTFAAREMAETMKGAADVLEFSYGFTILKHSYGKFDGKHVRFLEALNVGEVSACVRGAGVDTHLVEIRGRDPQQLEFAATARRLEREIAEAEGKDHGRHMRKPVFGHAPGRYVGLHPVDGSPVYTAA